MAALRSFTPDQLAKYYQRRPGEFERHACQATEVHRINPYQGHPEDPLRLPEGVSLEPGACLPGEGPAPTVRCCA